MALMWSTPATSQDIFIVPERVVATSSPVEITVSVGIRGPITLQAFGLDYLPGDRATGFTPGPLFQDWEVFDAIRTDAGIRVGGFDLQPLTIADEAILFTLTYNKTSSGCGTYEVGALVDDLGSLQPVSENIIWEFPPRSQSNQGSIGVFGNPEGTECCLQLSGPSTLYVVASLANDSAAGIEEAGFRIEVSPPAPGATINWQPSALVAASHGDPVQRTAGNDSAGTHVVLNGCQSTSKVLLGTLQVEGLTDEHELRVRRSNHPLYSKVTCSHFILCGKCDLRCLPSVHPAHVDPIVHVTRVNSPSCVGAFCGYVSLQAKDWSTVKRLYR